MGSFFSKDPNKQQVLGPGTFRFKVTTGGKRQTRRNRKKIKKTRRRY